MRPNSGIFTKRSADGHGFPQSVCKVSKTEETRYEMLADLISQIRYSLESIRGAVERMASRTYKRNAHGNVVYLNDNGGKVYRNYNSLENDNWNDNGRLLRRRYYLRSPALLVGVSCISFRCHPPSCRPTSSRCSERVIYFLLSNDFVSHAMRSRNFARSNFLFARSRYGSFAVLSAVMAEKISSVVSRNAHSIFVPSVYLRPFGKCTTQSPLQKMYVFTSRSMIGRLLL